MRAIVDDTGIFKAISTEVPINFLRFFFHPAKFLSANLIRLYLVSLLNSI